MDYIHKAIHGFENYITVEFSIEFQSVGWNDGDITMLDSIVNEEIGNQCIENNNIIWKRSVKRT